MRCKSLVHALLVGLMLVSIFQNVKPVQAQSEEVQSSEKTVNVQIVLDSSGSMAAATNTGELRYTAAQNVLHEVIGALPEESGVNVGLRVFGQAGDNTEAGRALSCESTELLVPVSGVDKPALTDAVNGFFPVGWTPMALALDSAGGDFITPASDSNSNVVVLVTDGLETCGGDPVSSAEALKSSEQGITTYVIGFGTTQEEQTTLNGVAQAGGGQLFGAQNAGELSSAIFDILEELEIVVGAGFVGGNAFGLLGTAPIGTIDVVAYSGGQYGALPIVVHNNLGQDVASVKVTMTIRGADGTLLASGDASQTISPRYLRAGGYAIGTVYLGPDFLFPADANVEFTVTYGPAAILSPYEKLDYDIIEAGIYEDRIVGSFENRHEVNGIYGVSLIAVCFDSAGTAVSVENGNLQTDPVLPGTQHTFQINRSGYWTGLPCDAFLVAASSHTPANIPSQPAPTLPSEVIGEPSTPDLISTPSASPATVNDPLPDGEAPYPLPVQDDRYANTWSNMPGVQDAAARVFVASNDEGLWIQILVAKFDSSERALASIPVAQERMNANMASGILPAFGEPVEVQTPDGFDDMRATFYRYEGTVPAQSTSLVIAAHQDELYIMELSGYTPSFDARVVDLLNQFVTKPAERGEGSVQEPTWGIWGLLPIASEVPAGYILDSTLGSYVPRIFGPIPPE